MHLPAFIFVLSVIIFACSYYAFAIKEDCLASILIVTGVVGTVVSAANFYLHLNFIGVI
jgi:hypothetical protein